MGFQDKGYIYIYNIPWTIPDVKRYNKGLKTNEKKKWTEIANAIIRDCNPENLGTFRNCDAKAVTIANTQIKKMYKESEELLERVPTSIKCIRLKKLTSIITGGTGKINRKTPNLSSAQKTVLRKKLKPKKHDDELVKLKMKTADKCNSKLDAAINAGASKSILRKRQRQLSFAAYRI